jgi:hypothetical protein
MKYKVTGQNRDTGARQTMEFEAGSKGAAERKATQAGMDVHRCEMVGEATEPEAAGKQRVTHRGEHEQKSSLGKILVGVAALIAAAAIFLNWGTIKGMVGM